MLCHGYGKRSFAPGWFYPGSGITSAFSTRGEGSEPRCYNFGIECKDDQDASSKEWRDTWRDEVFPKLEEFNPDLIFISAGFDAHRRDEMNHGHVQIEEPDYEWFTEHMSVYQTSVVQVLCQFWRRISCSWPRSFTFWALSGWSSAVTIGSEPAVTKELRDYERTFKLHETKTIRFLQIKNGKKS